MASMPGQLYYGSYAFAAMTGYQHILTKDVTWSKQTRQNRDPKGQIISECLFGNFNFLQKSEHKQVALRFHSSKVEFVHFLEETST